MKKVVSGIVSLGLIAILGSRVISDWEAIAAIEWNISFFRIVLFLISLLGIYVVNVFSWHAVVRSLNETVSLKENFSIWFMSNLVRLLPGGVWQYPSRVYLLSQKGVSKRKGAYAVALEVVFTLLMGICVSLATLPFWSLPDTVLNDSVLVISLAVFTLLLFVLTERRVLSFITTLYAKTTGNELNFETLHIKRSRMLYIALLFALRFIVIGTAFYILLSMIQPMSLSTLIDAIGMYSMAWLIGFLALFAPGGIGVTEGVLTLFLSQLMTVSIAAAAAIVFRIALIIIEVMFVLWIKTSSAFPVSKNT